MKETQASDFWDGVGEVVVRALMLGLLVVTGILFFPIVAPLVALWLIYSVLKPRPREVEPEYKVVE